MTIPDHGATGEASGVTRGPTSGDHFTQISNSVARDERLSYKARGIFTYIMSHREGWEITEEALARRSTDGISAVKSGLKELERYGYLARKRVRDPKTGRLAGAKYLITDLPAAIRDLTATLNDLRRSYPACDFLAVGDTQNSRSEPTCDFPTLENPTLENRTQDSLLIEDKKNKKTKEQTTKTLDQNEVLIGDEQPSLSPSLPSPRKTREPDRFEEFWRLYPRKVGKAAARKAWLKAIKTADTQVILDAAQLYALDARMKDPQYVAHPTTWLNQGRWDDEPATAGPSSSFPAASTVIQPRNGSGGYNGTPKPSIATQRTATGLALMQKYAAQDGTDLAALGVTPDLLAKYGLTGGSNDSR